MDAVAEPPEVQYLRTVQAHGLRLTPAQLALLQYIDWLRGQCPNLPSHDDPT